MRKGAKKGKKTQPQMQQYYPLTDPNEDEIERTKRWVDEVQK